MTTELSDDVLLNVLRGAAAISNEAANAAADRIEEYCTDAAVAEEALLRVYMAAGGRVEALPKTEEAFENHAHVEAMAQHALKFFSDEIQAKQRFARELLMHVTGKSYYDSGTKMRARWCLLCDTETPPDAERLAHKPGCLTAEAEEAAK